LAGTISTTIYKEKDKLSEVGL